MAASTAISGFGAVVEYLSTDPATYSPLGELVNVSPPNPTRETIDTTHHGSPGGWREFIASLKDGGEATFYFNFTKIGYALLHTLFAAGKDKFRVTFSSGSTYVFDLIPTAIPLDDIEVDGKMAMSMTGKVSGEPVFTATPA